MSSRLSARIAVGALVITACSDSPTGPQATETVAGSPALAVEWRPILDVSLQVQDGSRGPAAARAAGGDASVAVHGGTLTASAVLHWHALARELVAGWKENPPRAARAYALLSVAQYDALVALRHERSAAQPASSRGGAAAPGAERAALAAASAAVLVALFPGSADRVATELHAQLDAAAAGAARHDLARARATGAAVAAAVLAHATTDGADAVWTGTMPTGPGAWFSSLVPAQPPLLPHWGDVRPWLMRAGDQFRPQPPPPFGSPAFEEALGEVRDLSSTLTPEQLQIALYWADGPGTATPPGHWNAIAAGLIASHRMPELRAAWTFALLNMALFDASISCWDAKYAYWLIRPSQADPSITTAVELPNFPSYTSGHATFSGAAAALLGSVFPAHRRALHGMAEEAALSRVYGGIHYRFDSDAGLEAGYAIGRLAVEAGRRLNPGARQRQSAGVVH